MFALEVEAQRFYPAVLVKIGSGTKGIVLGVTERHRKGNWDIPVALTPVQARDLATELVFHADKVEGGL